MEQTDDIYRAIGKFTVKFEQIVFSLSHGIIFFLSSSGLKNQQLSNILLANLTAYPVKSIFGSMISEVVAMSDTEKKIVKEILKRVQAIIDKRNDIVHSTWFVGWASPKDTDFSGVSGHKLTNEKTGAGVKGFDYKTDDFDRFSDECDFVAELVNRLWTTIVSGSRIEENFLITPSGGVEVLKKTEKSS